MGSTVCSAYRYFSKERTDLKTLITQTQNHFLQTFLKTIKDKIYNSAVESRTPVRTRPNCLILIRQLVKRTVKGPLKPKSIKNVEDIVIFLL